MLDTGGTFADLVRSILGVFNIIIPVLGAFALVLFMVGAVRYIWNKGTAKDSNLMLWSVITLFVLFSVWGILRILMNTFSVGSPNNVAPSSLQSSYTPPAGSIHTTPY